MHPMLASPFAAQALRCKSTGAASARSSRRIWVCSSVRS
jgi:hypothetical protein